MEDYDSEEVAEYDSDLSVLDESTELMDVKVTGDLPDESDELIDFGDGYELDASQELFEDGMDDVRGWIGEVNPQYDPYDLESPYGSNCGSCATAVWDRFNGDEEAVATDQTLSMEEMEQHLEAPQVEATPEEIEDYVRSLGAGGHAVVGIDRIEGPGHWFNAYTPDGEHVYYVDGQTGEITGWPPTELGDVAKWDVSKREERA